MNDGDLASLIQEVRQSFSKIERRFSKSDNQEMTQSLEIGKAEPILDQNQTIQKQQIESQLGDIAKRVYDWRRKREEIIDVELFSEPAWDILLDLFHNRCLGKRVSVTSCCIASNVPPTTALRWISLLVMKEIIVRRPSGSDHRTTYLELTNDGYKKVAEVLKSIECEFRSRGFPE